MLKYKTSSIILIIVVLNIISLSCGSSTEPINYGHDECDFCRMLITDNRYGAELVTDKGKVFKFDEVGCLIEYAIVKNLIGDANQQFLVTDFSKPETFLDATKAFYVENENFRSPMGLNVSAFNDETASQNFISDNGGNKLNWIEVIELVKQRSM